MIIALFYFLCDPARCTLFFFNDTATTEIYTLSLHDALPILLKKSLPVQHEGPTPEHVVGSVHRGGVGKPRGDRKSTRLKSQSNLVCRLLLEKKKKTHIAPVDINVGPGATICLSLCVTSHT